ncbi:DUF1971 domain-containing protein [Sphingomonas jaspsi]|uniref:DUF1971 domain-containing protein n=1 Tax=Sphingomonas jaspsi TaxID=392409 RepID=UPI0004BB1E7B|nr:DUF1971 domain-containing protein [Sphingomonas jaspsi]
MRTYALPPAAVCYKVIGPFDDQTLPGGLTREHRLKPGVWAVIDLSCGNLHFTWDDGEGGDQLLVGPRRFVIPPEIPHYISALCDISLTISFFRPD